MKMDMKNKKTMLAAILVVAAFAAFSAAAVFEDSQSDAAATEISVDDITVVSGNLEIKASTPSMSYGLTGTNVTVNIAKDAGWSGKLYFGTVAGDKFDVKVALELTDAGNMTFDNSTGPVIVTGDAQGSVKMTEGSLTLGKSIGTVPFNGAVEGKSVTVTSQNTAGLVITATADEATDELSGEVVLAGAGASGDEYSVTIDGKAKFVTDSLSAFSVTGGTGKEISLVISETGTFDFAKGTDTIDNTVSFSYTDIEVLGTMTFYEAYDLSTSTSNNTTVSVYGEMKFTHTDVADATNMFVNATVNAAYYSTGADSPYTHTYTTLDKAMKNSADIYVSGEHFITKDTTLTGNSSAETPSNKITINTGAKVYTGVDMVPSDDNAVFTPITVTVPVTTTLDVTGTGTIDVQAGKLVWTATTPPTDEGDKIKADIFMVDGNNGIYTDLATALDLAKTDDVVKIRDSAVTGGVKLDFDATVKEGVTLDANKAKITVAKDKTFTVNGKVKDADDMFINGTVVLNSADFNFNPSSEGFTIEETGTLVFSESYDNTVADPVYKVLPVKSAKAGSVIDVNGEVKLATVATIAGEVNVYGTLIFANAVSIATLFVDETGDVSAGTNVIEVTGLFTAGTAPEDLTQYVNGAKAKVTLEDAAAVTSTVYGKAAGVTVTGAETTAYIFKDDSMSVVYATVTDGKTGSTRIYSLEFPAVEGKAFQAWFSLPSLVDSSVVEANDFVGDFSEVYAGFADATITVNLQNVPNATWVINEKVYASGNQIVEWAATYTIELKVANGYKLDGGDILVNGVVAGDELANGDSVTFSGNVVPEEVAPDTGLDMQTVLLAVIAAAAVVMAIVFIIRMMRS